MVDEHRATSFGERGGAITEMVTRDGSGVELCMSMIIEDDARGRDVSRGEMGIMEENWESRIANGRYF